jgi:uncharacterized alpha-E superfamily protein
VTWHLGLDAGDPDQVEAEFWQPLLGPTVDGAGANGAGHDPPADVRHYLTFDPDNPDSLISCVRRAREAARGVRESISSEMWEQLNTLYLSLADPGLAAAADEEPQGFYRKVREAAQFFQGLADCTLAHEEPWSFVELGKYLERADNVARILTTHRHLLMGEHASPSDEDLVCWLAILRSCGSAEAYARYYSLRVEPARVIEFLLLNPIFPQSVRFSIGCAWQSLTRIAEPRQTPTDVSNPAVRALGRLHARLEHMAVDEILEEGLAEYLTDLRHRITDVSDHVTAGYLRDEPQPGRLVAVARAAMIMAAQQQ